MNKLNLKKLGVQEMTTEEQMHVEGGSVWGWIKGTGRWIGRCFMNALR